MTRRDRLYEEYENALFTLLMEDVTEAEGQKALEENEMLKHDSSIVVPDSLYNKCLHIVQRGATTSQLRVVRKSAFRFVSKVAIIILILVLSLTVAFAVSPELRSTVARWIIEQYDDHTEFSMPDDGESDLPKQNVMDENGVWIGSTMELSVAWLPRGMKLVDKGHDNSGCWLIYLEESRRIVITANYLGDNSVNIDTENASLSFLTVSGQLALAYSSDDHCSVFIPLTELGGYLFIDTEGFSTEETIQISKGIVFK